MSEKEPFLTSTDSTKSLEDGCSDSPLIIIAEDIEGIHHCKYID